MSYRLWASLLVVLVLGTNLLGAEERTERPNFVIMIADDVSWNDLGCYGHPNVRTPHLDEMSRSGMRFTRAFLTTSSCSPSRCSILTGRYPHSTGAGELHQPLPASQVTFAKVLKKAGYFTASAGKWHLGKAAQSQFSRVLPRGGPSGCGDWVKVLRERPKDQPFFLWLASSDAHRPYRQRTIPRPHTNKDAVVPPFFPDVPDVRSDLALYYDEITRLDGYVGAVLAELKRQRIADNTWVLFLADNGRPFPRCKTTLYDSGIRTPFLVRWPQKVKAGTVCENLVSSVDIAPTVLELAGVKAPASLQGKSFASMLSDPRARIRDYIFAEHNWHDYQAHERAARSTHYLYIQNAFPRLPATPPADAVRSPTYRAMQKLHKEGKLNPKQRGCFITPRPKEELYHIATDPYCLKNLVNDPSQRATLQKHRQALAAWAKRTDDRVPEKPTHDRFDRNTGKRLGKK